MSVQLRVLYLADIRFPLERANGIQTMQTCHALADRGHTVTLVVRPDTASVPRDPYEFYQLPPCERLTIAQVDGHRRVAFLVGACRHARRARHDVVFTRDLLVADVLLRGPRVLRPPVVYESHTFAPEAAATMPDLLAGAEAASTTKQRRLLARERRVWRRAEGYITTTGVLARELCARFGRREGLAVVPNGSVVPAERSFAVRPSGVASVVAYAGQLYPWKGGDVFLQALARLPDVRGVVIGGLAFEGDLDRTRALAQSYGLADRLTFTGMVDAARLQAALQEADVLVLPTLATPTARFSSPLKLFEYLAAGKPIVASDLPAIREIVQDDVHACLVVPGDPEALAAGLRRVLEDRGLAARLARAAFALAPAWSWAARAKHVEQLLLAVVGR